MWTDSECVLKQIWDVETDPKAYVANRLSVIHSATKDEEWRYVESKKNLADHASRGIHAHESGKWNIFHRGPDFLYLPEDQWPKTQIPYRVSPIQRLSGINVATTSVELCACNRDWLDIVDKIELWHIKVKRVVFIKKIINKCKAYRQRRPKTRSLSHNAEIDWNVSSTEIIDAEKTIFRSVQREAFHIEYHAFLDARVNAPYGRRQTKTKNS